ncbi:MAG: hypothetical protein KAI33_11210, partial [Elusimicrobiales bacterium]|nr:hypothetical protein [Elusimicrobiales bacterium]
MENLINIVFCWVLGFGNLFSGPDKDFKTKRESMVKTQIENRGIKDKKVLGAMLKVERHEFVPLELRNYAYKDRPLPIGKGQTISQPYIVAIMTDLLKIKPLDVILEIGTGSG